jgi:hypothetical protein
MVWSTVVTVFSDMMSPNICVVTWHLQRE